MLCRLDASKRTTNICLLDAMGAVLKEGVVESDPKAIIGFLRGAGWRYRRVGMESWSLAPWLYAGLARAGLPIICIEARHSSAILKAKRVNKTDRNDARGIAEIMRTGDYKAVHINPSKPSTLDRNPAHSIPAHSQKIPAHESHRYRERNWGGVAGLWPQASSWRPCHI